MASQIMLQRREPAKVSGSSLGAQLKAVSKAVRGGFSLPFNSFNWYTAYGGYSSAGYTGWSSPFRYGANYYAGSDIDWNLEAGPSTQNSIIMATINFLAVAFQEAPFQIMLPKASGAVDVPEHPLTLLLEDPNPYYDSTVLWMSTIFSWNVSGNAYWIKWRNAADEVVQVWYEPHNTIRPIWSRDDPSTFITGYEVRRDNKWIPVEARNVVHFRWMQDPDNPRLGLSPIGSVLREIFTDKEGAAYTAVVLRNLGWPGYIISPASAEDDINEDDANRIKGEIEGNFTKDNRGRPMVSPRSVRVDTLGWSPNDLNVRDLRKIPEERITACLRVPAIVVGLGAGLDRSTFSNVSEAREQAYENNLVPTWRMFGRTITKNFRDDYPEWKKGMHASFDITEVRVLQEDYNRKGATIVNLFKNNVIMQDEARVAVNFDELPDDEGKKFWFQLVATGAGGGGKDPATGGPPAAGVDAANPQPPVAPAAPKDETPGPAPASKNGNGASKQPVPQAKDILEAFTVMRRAYPMVYTIEDERGHGDGSIPFGEQKFNQHHGEGGRFSSTDGGGHKVSTVAPSGAGSLETHDEQGKRHIEAGLKKGEDTDSDKARVRAKALSIAGVTEQIVNDPALLKAFGHDKADGAARIAVSKEVAKVVDSWGWSSSETPHVLAIQRAVSEEFGHPQSWKEMSSRLSAKELAEADKVHARDGEKNKAIVRGMYNHTQDTLEKEGVTEVTLHRGMYFEEDKAPKWTNYGYRDNVHLQPISSFSSDPAIATDFSAPETGSIGRVITTKVPRERIFSTGRTGVGELGQYEYVVLGTGKTPAKIHNTDDATGGAGLGEGFFGKVWTPSGWETKFNKVHGEHGHFASSAGGHHSSTRNPEGAALKLLGQVDAKGDAHIKRGESVGDPDVRSNAKSTLVNAVTDRVMASPAHLKAMHDMSSLAVTKEELRKQLPPGTSEEKLTEAHGYMMQAARTQVYSKVNRAVAQWAGNSGDTNTPSLAMQRAISEEFGHPKSWKEMEDRLPEHMKENVDQAHKKYGAENRAIARAMYDHTQETLAKEGIEEMTVHRGMRFDNYDSAPAPKWTNYGYRDNVHLQPVSSFATHPGVARSFSSVGSEHGIGRSVIVSTVVPRERIFSTARTGFGCLNEHEVVVLGTGPTPAKITKVTDANVSKIKKWDD